MDELNLGRRHPFDELQELRLRPPYRSEPVRVWVAWFERQAELWDALALIDPWQTDTATSLGEYLRRKAKDMREQYKPHEKWPGAVSW